MKFVYNYLPNPRKDPKTGEIIGQIYYPVIPIKLCYEQKVPLLGRNGFFNYFKKVIFREKENVVELETEKDL